MLSVPLTKEALTSLFMTTVSRPLYASCLANMRAARFRRPPSRFSLRSCGRGASGGGGRAIMETKLRIPRFSPRPSRSFLPSFLSPLNDDDERPRNRPIPSAGITAETTRFSRVLSGFRDYTSK